MWISIFVPLNPPWLPFAVISASGHLVHRSFFYFFFSAIDISSRLLMSNTLCPFCLIGKNHEFPFKINTIIINNSYFLCYPSIAYWYSFGVRGSLSVTNQRMIQVVIIFCRPVDFPSKLHPAGVDCSLLMPSTQLAIVSGSILFRMTLLPIIIMIQISNL